MNTPFDKVIDQVEETSQDILNRWLESVNAPDWVIQLLESMIYLRVVEQQDSITEIKAAVAKVVEAMPEAID